MKYKQLLNLNGDVQSVYNLTDLIFIPLDPLNSDYQKMKNDLLSGAELQDSTGAVIDGKMWAATLK